MNSLSPFFTISSSVFAESLVTQSEDKMVLEIKRMSRKKELKVNTILFCMNNKPSVVPERSHANKRVANVDYYFSPPPPSPLRCTFEERAAVLTLTERGWQSRRALAGLISMTL